MKQLEVSFNKSNVIDISALKGHLTVAAKSEQLTRKLDSFP